MSAATLDFEGFKPTLNVVLELAGVLAMMANISSSIKGTAG